MTETTQKDRDKARRVLSDEGFDQKLIQPTSWLIALLNDADRLAAVERQVRELAYKCEQHGHVGPKHPRNFGMRDVATDLRVMLDAPDAGRDPRSYPATMCAEDDQQPVDDAPDAGGGG